MEWSLIEFAEPQYIVCEDAERLEVAIIRSGGLEQTATVSVKHKAMSAKSQADYLPPEEELITFEPGVNNTEQINP